jgi:hypothetical protein
MSEISQVISDDLKPILSVLDQDDADAVLKLRDELADNWKKKQIFRTEVEMRIAVLNDVQHPTDASKYWQAVREMSTMFDSLMHLSFDLRRNEVKREKLGRKLNKAKDLQDDLKVKSIQIDIDENLFAYANMKQVASDRIRELKLWSQLKNELDSGEFDTQNVNEHQYEAYKHYWENRVNALNGASSPGDVMNALGPKLTIQRLRDESTGKLISFAEARKLIEQEVANLEK